MFSRFVSFYQAFLKQLFFPKQLLKSIVLAMICVCWGGLTIVFVSNWITKNADVFPWGKSKCGLYPIPIADCSLPPPAPPPYPGLSMSCYPQLKEPQPINYKEVKKAIQVPQELHIPQGRTMRVIVRMLVDENGLYNKHSIILSNHPLLTQAVESKITQLRFTQHAVTDKPYSYWVNIPFSFKGGDPHE